MPVGLLGKKVGMTQVYNDAGVILPVTVLEVGPCTVLQVRTSDRDGYSAVQLGFDDKLSENDKRRAEGDRNRSRATRPERGHVAPLKSKRQRRMAEAGVEVPAKANCEPKRFVREFRIDGEEVSLEVGAQLDASHLEGVARVDVVGISKGRGTAGAMKRHGFAGQPASHGAKKVHRRVGGIGSLSSNLGTGTPKKGKRMAGRYGNARATVRNLKVVRTDAENNMLLVEGAVPGPNGGYVVVRVAR